MKLIHLLLQRRGRLPPNNQKFPEKFYGGDSFSHYLRGPKVRDSGVRARLPPRRGGANSRSHTFGFPSDGQTVVLIVLFSRAQSTILFRRHLNSTGSLRFTASFAPLDGKHHRRTRRFFPCEVCRTCLRARSENSQAHLDVEDP